MTIEFPVEDTNLSSGPGANFRGVNRPTESGVKPVFLGVDPLKWAVTDKEGGVWQSGVTPPG